MSALAQNLRRLRDGRYTQHGLEAASTVSRSTIADIERGERTRCDSDTLLRLANALGCTVDELLRPSPPSATVVRRRSIPARRKP